MDYYVNIKENKDFHCFICHTRSFPILHLETTILTFVTIQLYQKLILWLLEGLDPGSVQRATLLLVSCIVLLKCNFLNVYFHLNIFAEPDKIHYKPEKVWTVHLSERCCRITIQSCGRNISFIFNNFRFKIFVLSVEYFKYLIQRIKNQIQHYMLCFSYREL